MNKKRYFAFLDTEQQANDFFIRQEKPVWQEWREIELGPEVARGGEGIIYKIKNMQMQLVKIFHNPSPDKESKLRKMLRKPPKDPVKENGGHISIAWPLTLVRDERKVICGFVMPYIDPGNSFPLLKVYNHMDRLRLNLDFTWEYFIVMALNLSNVVHELHKLGYVIGDLNESNILVTREAGVTLVDCDSIQVPRRKRLHPGLKDYFLCTVGKPEYTPPELQRKDFNTVLRTEDHDNFSLAVLIFLMLMEGRHPFSFKWKKSGREPLTLEESIRGGYFPYDPDGKHAKEIAPPPYAIPFEILPSGIRELMINAFKKENHRPEMINAFKKENHRPDANEWCKALTYAREHLTDCSQNDYHTYSEHLQEKCPWCQRKKDLGGEDPFPHTTGKLNQARLERLRKQQEQQGQQEQKRQNGYTGGLPTGQGTRVRQPEQEVTAPLPKGVVPTSLKRRKKGNPVLITAVIGAILLLLAGFGLHNGYDTLVVPKQNIANLLTNAISGKPLLVDSLHSNPAGYWPQNHDCQFSKGAYYVQGLSTSLKTCVSSDPKLRLDNAVIMVDVTLSSGSGEAGLVLRANGQRFYVFELTDRGAFSFLRHDPGKAGYTSLTIQTASSEAYFNPGGLNTLAVIANGSDFKFYINQIFVGESHDGSYGGGEVGFAASGKGNFSNLKIYPAP